MPFGGAEDEADPLADVERLSEVELDESAESVAIAAPANAPGFFASLFGAEESDTTESESGEVTAGEDAGGAEEADANAPDVIASPAPRRGLFGLFGGNSGTGAGAVAPVPDPDQVAPGTMQAFGEVGKTCGLSRGDRGTRIASVAGFDIYDTNPGSTAARPHYITGFSDRCARQFTAALVLTGDVGTHEVVRYQGSGRNLPYTETDEAYEAIKRQFCGAGRGQPCGGRLDALARNTTFITAYQTFETSRNWAEILVHNGDFVAVSVESRR